MTNKDKKIQGAAKCLSAFGVIALLSLAFRLWPVFILAVFLSAVAGARYVYLTKKETVEQADETVRAPKEKEKPVTPKEESLQDFVTDSINKLMASEYPEEDWIWEYPDPVRRIGKREDVCIILFGSNGFRKTKVVFSGYSATALEFPEDTADEQIESDSPSQAQSASTVVTDYGLIAFEWTDAHITELNGRCNDAIGRGEKELVLASVELPVRESWDALCEELLRVGVKSAECRENGIAIGLA